MRTKLEQYLADNGVTQSWLAKQIGTTSKNLHLLVTGKSSPSLRLAYEIEKKTKGAVTVYDWIENEGEIETKKKVKTSKAKKESDT